MVCIAAFIILLLISVPVLGLAIIGKFNERVAKLVKPYFMMFKKAWYCVGRRVTFRKCDSNFKSEIKDSVLSRLVVRHKKWIKPVSVSIEIAAVLVVALTAWSLVEAAKAGMSLYVFGTCDVRQPEACLFGDGQVCSTETAEEKNFVEQYFYEWGEIFQGIPARIRNWNAQEFITDEMGFWNFDDNKPYALDIFDPGCVNCLKSFNNQLAGGFFDNYNVALMPYSTSDHESEDGYKFPNSHLIAQYIVAARGFARKGIEAPEWEIVKKLFTEKDDSLDVVIVYQEAFNGVRGLSGTPYTTEKAVSVLKKWLREMGFSASEIEEIAKKAESEEVEAKIAEYRRIVDDDIRTKGTPTLIFDGQRHIGVWR